jgi:hypothetical protein
MSIRALLSIAVFFMAIAPAGAVAPATGLAVMQLYAGTWHCTGGAPGEPPGTGVITYALSGGILRESSVLHPLPNLLITGASAMTYDAKHARLVLTDLDNLGNWAISVSKPRHGATEYWTTTASSDANLGRATVVHVDANTYVFTAWEKAASTKPNLRVHCKRAM